MAGDNVMAGRERFTLGILSKRIPGNADRPFGSPTGFFEECSAAAEALHMNLIVFDAGDIDMNTSCISASRFEFGRWSDSVPSGIPDIIYDRAPLFDPAYSPLADQVRSRFTKSGIPFVNPTAFLRFAGDKLETYKQLRSAGIRVPETAACSPASLELMFERSGQFFLKPRNGSNGAGIIEVQRTSGNQIQLRYQACLFTVNTMAQLVRTASVITRNRLFEKGVYLVQQGISSELPHRRRYPQFDLRAIVQKNSIQAWEVTGIVARVAARGSATTNLSTGARAEEPEPVLERVYGRKTTEGILSDIEIICISLCSYLDQKVCRFGELGVDIIIDENANSVVLEVNAKPGRASFKRIAFSEDVSEETRKRYRDIRLRSVSIPIHYAHALAASRWASP
ncbi:MAG: YheC/YheD family protein [Candidatus Latescibacteria bacterium]|nr:YheC/YheD family protein [Candidatus Latescibacterota bacterium]